MSKKTSPLRPEDPASVGDYELLGRLGSGGMGTVYLARARNGRQVAVKVVHADLADDDEFRARFRSEVSRARQVPPFCTAEVLDADPEAERPWLVVEFVDGPSLAEEVAQRGPLTSSNLHGVAIGVATALTAIHEAGVIHRDLKPHNVLLAPGSPKVIDFGIARALEPTTQHTRTGQFVGTINYMAPERFGDPGTPLTPAADVFAWGCVVAYAGTGRAPFDADSPMATFARILTQPPTLDGLDGPLRDLVERSLSADPERRPTARELLDGLLSSGSGRTPKLADDALDRQPELRSAAIEVRQPAPTHQGPTPPAPTHRAPVPPAPTTGYSQQGSTTSYSQQGSTTSYSQQGSTTPTNVFQPTAFHQSPAGTPYAPPPPYAAGPPPVPKKKRARGLVAAVVVMTLALCGGCGWVAYKSIANLGVTVSESASEPTQDGPQELTLPDYAVAIEDPLTEEGQWTATEIVGEEDSHCGVTDGALRVQRASPGFYMCAGPDTTFSGNHSVEVTGRIEEPGTCLGIWIYWEIPQSYLVTACEDAWRFGAERPDSGESEVLEEWPTGISTGEDVRLQVVVEDGTIRFGHDDELVGEAELTEDDITAGHAAIGLVNDPADTEAPFKASFNDIVVKAEQ